MIEKNVKCKVVTPIFSRSLEFEDEQQKVVKFELRPQSVKGVLHFWFRAVAPRVIDVRFLKLENLSEKEKERYKDQEYKGLKYLEDHIFGSQNNKSSFSIIVEWQSKDTNRIGEIKKRGDNKYSFVFSEELGEDASYPLYGLYNYDRRTGEPGLISKYLKIGAEFNVTFFLRNENVWDVLFSLLKITSVLSGFGAKTTKGFGEFEILDPKVDRNAYLSIEGIKKLITEAEESIKRFIKSRGISDVLDFKKSTNIDFPSLLEDKFEFFPINRSTQNFSELLKSLYNIKTKRENERIIVTGRGWYRELKFRMRKYGRNQTHDCVKELVKCINGSARQADIGPAIIALPLQYQNLKVYKGKPNKITIYPVNALGEEGRKPATLRIIISYDKKFYKAYGLIIKSKVADDNRLSYEAEPSQNLSQFSVVLSTNFQDLSKEAKSVK